MSLASTILSSSKDDIGYLQEVFSFVTGVAVDSEGYIIFVDQINGKIFKFKVETGKILTIAGSGTVGFRDGRGRSANFNNPHGVAVGSDDVIYVGDHFNKAIRKITNENVVSTLISGDKVGNVQDIAYYEADKTIYYVSRTFIGRVQSDGSGYRLWAGSTQGGYKDGIGANARFYQVYGISVNQITGVVYVIEYGDGTLRKIDRDQQVTTIHRGFDGPNCLHVIRNDSIVITEFDGNLITRYSFETQKVTVVAGTGNPGLFDGAGKDADISRPFFITWNPHNDEIIFSEWDLGIRVINKFNLVSTVLMPMGFGLADGPSHKARISSLINFDIDEKDETLYFVDQYNNSIRKAAILNGTVETMSGKPYAGNVNGNVSDALFSSPYGIAYYNQTLLIGDYQNNLIKKLTLNDNIVDDFLTYNSPIQISVDQSKSSFYLMRNFMGSFISKYDMDGALIHNLGSGRVGCVDGYYDKASVTSVQDIYTMTTGTAYFTDFQCSTIRVFDSKTLYISVLAGKSETAGYADGIGGKALFNGIWGLDYTAEENSFYVNDCYSNIIRQVTLDGNVTTLAGSIEGGYRNGPIRVSLFQNPTYLKVLSNGNIIVSDEGNYAVRQIKKKDGIVETLFGYGSQKYHQNPGQNVDLNYPIGITSKGSNIYVLNKEDNNILGYSLENQDRFLLTGNGAIGWTDGDYLAAMFNRPEDIHYSAELDCIFVADTQNHLIRKTLMQGFVSTFAGTGKKGLKNDVLLASEFNLPSSVTTDPSGNLFVADSGNNVIRKISNGKVSIFAGSGVGVTNDLVNGKLLFAKFSFPTGIDYNRMTDSLVVADMYNHAIRVINSTHVSTLAGNGSSGFMDGPYSIALFSYPRKVAVDQHGIIYVTESYSDMVRKLADEKVSTILTLKNPLALHVANSVLYVSEYNSNLVKSVFVGKSGTFMSTEGTSGPIVSVVILSLCLILLASFASFLFAKKRWKSKIVTTEKLKTFRKSDPVNAVVLNEKTGTVTMKQSYAFAVPGYLELQLKDSVAVSEYGGKGGTAAVVLGKIKDPKLIEKHGFVDVAVKFLNEAALEEDFYYEITIMNAFPKSDNIVELVGYSSSKPLAIVMKSYPSSLSELISMGNYKNDSKVKLKIALDIAKGMGIIHQCGVIHFDLKPANILVHNVNNSLTCAVCDFGFANFSSDAKVNLVKGVKAPRTNGITARYAAPEQFHGDFSANRLDQEIYKKVDVFSYAMTIYYVFTGSKPWKSEDKVDKIEELVCAGERPDLSESMASNGIRDLIKNCWAHEALERPSFTEIIEVIEKKVEIINK